MHSAQACNLGCLLNPRSVLVYRLVLVRLVCSKFTAMGTVCYSCKCPHWSSRFSWIFVYRACVIDLRWTSSSQHEHLFAFLSAPFGSSRRRPEMTVARYAHPTPWHSQQEKLDFNYPVLRRNCACMNLWAGDMSLFEYHMLHPIRPSVFDHVQRFKRPQNGAKTITLGESVLPEWIASFEKA